MLIMCEDLGQKDINDIIEIKDECAIENDVKIENDNAIQVKIENELGNTVKKEDDEEITVKEENHIKSPLGSPIKKKVKKNQNQN